jgi:hypothetical protein
MDIRTPWRRYLDAHSLQAKALLRDGVHLNDWGNYLLAELIKQRLIHRPDLPPADSDRMVRTYRIGEEIAWEAGRLILEFTGNRLDAISSRRPGDHAGKARVLIDGRKPSEFPDLYAFPRSSYSIGVDWPNIMRMGCVAEERVAEDWTVRLLEVSDDHERLVFSVEGSVTGPDGGGVSTEKFVSESGRLAIEPGDWHVARSFRFTKEPVPVGYEITFSVVPMHTDTYAAPPVEDTALEYPTTLALGLENGKHRLELIADGEEPPIAALRVYEPPMR